MPMQIPEISYKFKEIIYHSRLEYYKKYCKLAIFNPDLSEEQFFIKNNISFPMIEKIRNLYQLPSPYIFDVNDPVTDNNKYIYDVSKVIVPGPDNNRLELTEKERDEFKSELVRTVPRFALSDEQYKEFIKASNLMHSLGYRILLN